VGLVELISSFRADRKIKKLLRGARPRALTELREGEFVRVMGSVEPHRQHVLEAPLSGRLCAYYSIVVRARATQYSWSTRRPRTSYRTVAEEQQGFPFELDGDHARAIVDPTDAWISSGFDYKCAADEPRARAWCRDCRSLDRFGLDDLTLQEAALELGEKVVVFGAGVFEPDRAATAGEQGYRDAGAMRFRFSGTAQFPLVIRDDLQDL